MKSRHARTGVRALVYTLILTTTLVCTLNSEGRAMLVPAETPAATSSLNRSSDMKTIQGALESKVLRARLKELGLTDAEINLRLSRLSDKQVHQLAFSCFSSSTWSNESKLFYSTSHLSVHLVTGVFYGGLRPALHESPADGFSATCPTRSAFLPQPYGSMRPLRVGQRPRLLGEGGLAGPT